MISRFPTEFLLHQTLNTGWLLR